MSRSTFLTSFETGETNNSANNEHNQFVRIHHRLIPTISGNSRSNESLPIVVVQKNSSNLNPKLKRNLRGKRRSTGIRSDDVALASALNEPDDDDDQNSFVPNETKTIETFETNRTSPPKPIFKVTRVQPNFDENSRSAMEKLSINRTDSFPSTVGRIFRAEEFLIRRETNDDETTKRRAFEERIRNLESLNYEKDAIIHDLQRKLDQKIRELGEAEQQIFVLQRDKLSLIKSLTSVQEAKGNDLSLRTNFLQRN